MLYYRKSFEADFAKNDFLEFVLYLSAVLAGNILVIYAIKLDDKAKTILLLYIHSISQLSRQLDLLFYSEQDL